MHVEFILGEFTENLAFKATLKDSLRFADEFERGLRDPLRDIGVIPS